jgi:hypothetical protein
MAEVLVISLPSEENPNCFLFSVATEISNRLQILFFFSSRRENGIDRAVCCVSKHSSLGDLYEVEERTSYMETTSISLPVRRSVCDQASTTKQFVP